MTNTLTQSTLTPKAQLFTLALAALVAPTTTAFSAVATDYINDGDALMVSIGDARNDPDPANNVGGTTFGGVPYEYSIGKYAVTNAQYAKFLNAVDPTGLNNLALYSSSMSGTLGGIEKTDSANEGSKYAVKSGTDANGMSYGDKPVNYVSFWDAARFCNWLTNGGTEGANTETGMYALNGEVNPENASISRQLSGSGYAVSSENEWYKAAYYNGDGTYRTYPVTGELSQEVANYYDGKYAFESPYITAVDYYDGADGASSYYGTFQQGGNVWEWVDTTIENDYRGLRGGSFSGTNGPLASSTRYYDFVGPVSENDFYGFRISSLAVPEPSTYGLMGGAAALLGAIALRRRNRRD